MKNIPPYKPNEYCTQAHGYCPECSLVNYDRDCMNNPVDYARFEQVTFEDMERMYTDDGKPKAT